MPKNLAVAVSGCGKAIRQIFSSGKSPTSGQERALSEGHDALVKIINDISRGKSKYGECVRRVLHGIHSRTVYTPTLMIRDVAEIGVIVEELEEGAFVEIDRVLEVRMTNAKFFCQHLAEELNELE